MSASTFLFTVVILYSLPLQIAAFEGLLQAAGEVRKDRPAVPLRFASPDWNVYHRTQHLESRLAFLISTCQSASHLSVHTPSLDTPPQHSTVSQPVPLEDDSNSLRYITIAHKPSPRELAGRIMRRARTTRIMFVFGETGRDLLSSEIALRVVEIACSSNVTNVLSGALSDVELVLVPIANPAGRRIAEMGRRCEHTNANDVDLDRNWPRFWNEPSRVREPPQDTPHHAGTLRDAGRVLGVSLSRHVAPSRHGNAAGGPDSAAEHRLSSPFSAGSEPFSEPETRALRAIVEKLKPVSYVSVRTGAVAVSIPLDCHPAELSESQQSRLLRVAEGITASHCTKCKTGNLWNVTGHTKCGTAADYMFDTLRVPFVHTWHVYNVPQAAHGDCFRRHNPVTKDGYERVVTNWAQGVFNFTTAVHNWMTLETSVGLDSAEQNASLSAAQAGARRADAMARGLPDPEKVEEFEVGEHVRGNRRGKATPGKEKIFGGEGAPKKPGLFSWIFDEDSALQGGSAHPNRKSNVNGSHRFDSGDDKLGPLTGWVGVCAALLLLASGIFVVRRFIFGSHPKKSLFRTRRPVKNA